MDLFLHILSDELLDALSPSRKIFPSLFRWSGRKFGNLLKLELKSIKVAGEVGEETSNARRLCTIANN